MFFIVFFCIFIFIYVCFYVHLGVHGDQKRMSDSEELELLQEVISLLMLVLETESRSSRRDLCALKRAVPPALCNVFKISTVKVLLSCFFD